MERKGSGVMAWRNPALRLALLTTPAFAWPMPAAAQVAPTEVNEKAVDEFGLDRKTGRFTWSTEEIIAIGGEGSRVSVAVTGVDSPPHAVQVMPAQSHLAQLNGPRLSIAPYPADSPQFPGEIDPSRHYVTVDYWGGSHTFECTAQQCFPQYFNMHTLIGSGAGYIFTDNQGLEITFELAKSVVTYPDGKRDEFHASGTRWNNFGFLLKASNGTFQAINQAVDYCDVASASACLAPTTVRTAHIPTAFTNPVSITDSAGGVTKLRWIEKTAKESRPPQGDNGTIAASILNLSARYLLGVTLPGSTSEDVTVSYNAIDPLMDTHDDIRVSSIVRNGVTVDYEMLPYWPFGRATEVAPNQNTGGEELIAGTFLINGLTTYTATSVASAGANCSSMTPPILDINGGSEGSYVVCYGEHGSLGGGGGISVPPYTFNTAPPDEDDPLLTSAAGSQIYELQIVARVGGELVSKSNTLRPYSNRGLARRRLMYVKDGLGRKTNYFYNPWDEVAGIKHPEGNTTTASYDIRGNHAGTVSVAKPGSNLADIVTSYTYSADCSAIPPARCNKPLTATDANGNVTEYTYNDRGQVLTETRPAPAPGAARPRVTNSYTLRTAYIRNAGGGAVAAGPPISLLTRSSTCHTLASCAGTADEVVTEYDYGPATGLNNLLLRGIAVTAENELGQMETLRTCFQYNYFGEKIAETQPQAGLASCP